MANTTNQVPGFAEERARLIQHDAPDPGRHPSVNRKTWIILGAALAVMVALIILLVCTEQLGVAH